MCICYAFLISLKLIIASFLFVLQEYLGLLECRYGIKTFLKQVFPRCCAVFFCRCGFVCSTVCTKALELLWKTWNDWTFVYLHWPVWGQPWVTSPPCVSEEWFTLFWRCLTPISPIFTTFKSKRSWQNLLFFYNPRLRWHSDAGITITQHLWPLTYEGNLE